MIRSSTCQFRSGPWPAVPENVPGNTKAILKGQVNPEGKATTYHFDYISDEDFVANGGSFSGPNPASSSPESPSVGSDFTLHPAEASIGCPVPADPPQPSCLKPEAQYHIRLVAKNEDGESSAASSFKSLAPFVVESLSSTKVGTSTARLHATVNPLGIPATGYFEYVDDASYQADLAEGPGTGGARKKPWPGGAIANRRTSWPRAASASATSSAWTTPPRGRTE